MSRTPETWVRSSGVTHKLVGNYMLCGRDAKHEGEDSGRHSHMKLSRHAGSQLIVPVCQRCLELNWNRWAGRTG